MLFIPHAHTSSTAPYARKNAAVVSPIAIRSLSMLIASPTPKMKVSRPSTNVSPAATARGAGVPWGEYGERVVGSGSDPSGRRSE